MSRLYAPRTYIPTGYILAVFFAIMTLGLIAASVVAHERATDATQSAASADDYQPAADEPPVVDAVPEKS